MKFPQIRSILPLAVVTGCLVFFMLIAQSLFAYPFSHIKLPPMQRYVTQDVSGVILGARRLAADVAWLQLLQYYGSGTEPMDKEEEYELSWDVVKFFLGFKIEHGEHHHHVHTDSDGEGPIVNGYPDLFLYCKRIVDLDPFFFYAYLYGAGALAWNEDRPDEAIALIKDGIDKMESFRKNITVDPDQPYWQMNLYLGSIMYRKEGKYEEMLSSLESAVKQKDCPNMIKVILSSIYEQRKNYMGALRIWVQVYDSGDPMYRQRSLEKISELRKYAGI